MSWLVTGASGFLGRHLLEQLSAEPVPLPALALLRNPAGWAALGWTAALRNVQPIAGSLEQPERWTESPPLDGLTGIFHLAAEVRHGPADAAAVQRTNVEGTLHMVRLAARRRCRLVFVSTSGTVGCSRRPGALPDEDAPFCEQEVAEWPYYRSKIEAERAARALADQLGVQLVILRPPVLLGPGDHRYRSSQHVLRLLRGQVPFVIRGGMHFADVRDVARAMLRAMQRETVRPVYHLPGTIGTIGGFYREVARLAGRRPPRLVIPYPVARLAAGVAARLGMRSLPEPRLIEMASRHWGLATRYADELGYRSRPGSDTLRDTIDWLTANPPEPSRP
ncbi:MAG TPA: NAD-dependent epimerase/dehydratase family protein [Gemmatimonadales bacterium]|nr:NAD-dependent epimerase/dehydratase family protein [Gemmatimonadales bacterium]